MTKKYLHNPFTIVKFYIVLGRIDELYNANWRINPKLIKYQDRCQARNLTVKMTGNPKQAFLRNWDIKGNMVRVQLRFIISMSMIKV